MRMLPIAAAAIHFIYAPTAAPAHFAKSSVTATVGWSEWCPPGIVTVDLDDGSFRWLQQLPRQACKAATSLPDLRGKLPAKGLGAIRDAVRTARTDGLSRQECTNGKPSERIVLSNAAAPYLLTIVEARSGSSAPGDLSCWSDAAFKLQRLMDATFSTKISRTGR